MNKNKLNTTPLKATLEEIEKSKDFNSLLKKAKNVKPESSNSWLKKGFLGSIMLITALICLLVINKTQKEEAQISSLENQKLPTHIHTRKGKITPPLEGFDVPFEVFEINNQKGASLETQKGTFIDIAKNTFLDSLGNTIQGNVSFKFREFHNPFEIFLAGIPMHYDSSKYDMLESAGMFELKAYQGSQSLNIDQNKSIEVDLISYNDFTTTYNDYYFNEADYKWEYKKQSNCKPFTESIANKKDISVGNQPITNISEPKYNIRNEDVFAFHTDINHIKFPELHPKTVFEVNKKKSSFKPIYYEINWDEIQLNKNNNEYLLVLKKGSKKVEVSCYPTLPLSEYQELLEQRLNNQKSNEKAQITNNKRSKSRDLLGGVDQRLEEILRTKTGRRVKKRFRINFRIIKTGLYNCDSPLDLLPVGIAVSGGIEKKAETLKKISQDQENTGQIKVSNTAVLNINPEEIKGLYSCIDKKNTLFENFDNTLTYTKKEENTYWVVYNNNSVGFIKPQQVNSLKKSQTQSNLDIEILGALDAVRKLKEVL